MQKNNKTSAEFHHQLLLQKPDYSVRHHSLQMLTEIVTSWISRHRCIVLSSGNTLQRKTCKRFDNWKISGLGHLKKCNTSLFSVLVSEASDANKMLVLYFRKVLLPGTPCPCCVYFNLGFFIGIKKYWYLGLESIYWIPKYSLPDCKKCSWKMWGKGAVSHRQRIGQSHVKDSSTARTLLLLQLLKNLPSYLQANKNKGHLTNQGLLFHLYLYTHSHPTPTHTFSFA